ncbi:hypothetical protein CROQUDRAFT_101450 [Cronartium quercuum f. sp. fusiforme G11]|uniref:Uncharacterized protein n=1 Tax=Cronartium quercuum f. sp. fusiforme G11 TaxID=708437 RepID=A0A9P6T5M3_9BASI|nr:hypothetical protein CROQUDRAFT_101450 [Cronartium quercuum f. sp. fusiforme G11]
MRSNTFPVDGPRQISADIHPHSCDLPSNVAVIDSVWRDAWLHLLISYKSLTTYQVHIHQDSTLEIAGKVQIRICIQPVFRLFDRSPFGFYINPCRNIAECTFGLGPELSPPSPEWTLTYDDIHASTPTGSLIRPAKYYYTKEYWLSKETGGKARKRGFRIERTTFQSTHQSLTLTSEAVGVGL